MGCAYNIQYGVEKNMEKKEYLKKLLSDVKRPVRVRQDEQPYAACDRCNTVNNFDRYKYKGKTWCEACLETELGVTTKNFDEIDEVF
jgi:hypothetical protein